MSHAQAKADSKPSSALNPVGNDDVIEAEDSEESVDDAAHAGLPLESLTIDPDNYDCLHEFRRFWLGRDPSPEELTYEAVLTEILDEDRPKGPRQRGRAKCQRCGRRPNRRILCPECEWLVGPGCCWVAEADKCRPCVIRSQQPEPEPGLTTLTAQVPAVQEWILEGTVADDDWVMVPDNSLATPGSMETPTQ